MDKNNPSFSYSAFTVKSDTLKNVLKSKVKISANGTEIECTAIWDTGATTSCISKEVASSLSLVQTGKIPINTPSGKTVVNTYLIDVTLPNDVQVKDLMVCDSEIGAQGIGILIGMNIISRGDFCVTNHDGKTVFTFVMPSYQTIDFVKNINIGNIIGSAQHGKGKFKPKKKH